MNKHITIKHNQPTMTVEETIELLNKAGYKAAICDTWVKEYDVKIKCGNPEEIFTEDHDWVAFPKEMLDRRTTCTIFAKGDSMIEEGICDGDELVVRMTPVAAEEEIVVAIINHECTVKVYFKSDEGETYLLPRNASYPPILVKETDDFRIVGVVEKVMKSKSHVSGRLCRKILKDAKLAKAQKVLLTDAKVKSAIDKMEQKITNSRQWYSVFRILVDRGYYLSNDSISTFVGDVAKWVPEHPCLPNVYDFTKVAQGCFRKPVAFWNPEDAPVTGKRYIDYLDIATSFGKVL